MQISEMVRMAHANARAKGFWGEPREVGTLLALIHSEISEALEAHRHGNSEHVAEELADAVIRIGDFAGGANIDLEQAIEQKMAKNAKRPYKHGKQY